MKRSSAPLLALFIVALLGSNAFAADAKAQVERLVTNHIRGLGFDGAPVRITLNPLTYPGQFSRPSSRANQTASVAWTAETTLPDGEVATFAGRTQIRAYYGLTSALYGRTNGSIVGWTDLGTNVSQLNPAALRAIGEFDEARARQAATDKKVKDAAARLARIRAAKLTIVGRQRRGFEVELGTVQRTPKSLRAKMSLRAKIKTAIGR
jgi:hypothetical protein